MLLKLHSGYVLVTASSVLQVFSRVSKAVVVAVVQMIAEVWWERGPQGPVRHIAAGAAAEVQWAAHATAQLGCIRLVWVAMAVCFKTLLLCMAIA